MLVSAHTATAAAQHGVTPAHVGSNVEFSISHIAQSHAIVDAARHGAHRPRLLPRCAPCPPLLAAPLACSQHDVLPATCFSAMNSCFCRDATTCHVGLRCEVQILLGTVYANTIDVLGAPVRRRCMAPLGGIMTRYAKAKNAAGPIGGAPNLSRGARR